MKDEVSAAVLFLIRLIEKNKNINPERLEDFKERLSELLLERFKNHWFPDKPFKGQGYRCIRLNECDRTDPVIAKAAVECGLKYEDLKLPVELTIWVDPEEVCCRFGEHKGSYCTLASFKDSNKENVDTMGHLSQEIKQPVSPSESFTKRSTKRAAFRQNFNCNTTNIYRNKNHFNNGNLNNGNYVNNNLLQKKQQQSSWFNTSSSPPLPGVPGMIPFLLHQPYSNMPGKFSPPKYHQQWNSGGILPTSPNSNGVGGIRRMGMERPRWTNRTTAKV